MILTVLIMARTKQTARNELAKKETKVPVKETKAPAKKETKETKVPVKETKAPAKETKVPVKETKAPAKKETKVPVKETKAPAKKETKETKAPAKKETKAPAKKETKETKVPAKKETTLADLEKRLEKCEKTINSMFEEIKIIKTDIETIKNVDISEAKTHTESETKTSKTHTESETKTHSESKKDKKEDKIDISSLKRPELLSKLEELGIKESDVKRLDGNKGKPIVSDFRAALEKALSKKSPKEKEEHVHSKSQKTVSVEIHLDKGYGTDENGFVYTLVDPMVVAKLVKGKPSPLTEADIKVLKKLAIRHGKKSSAELKTLLTVLPTKEGSETSISVGDLTSADDETTGSMSSLQDSSIESSNLSVDSSATSTTVDSSATSTTVDEASTSKVQKKVKIVEDVESSLAKTEKESADDAAEGTETIKEDDSEDKISKKAPLIKKSGFFDIYKDDKNDSEESSSSSDEGEQISKNFEKAPLIKKSEFSDIYNAVTDKKINLSDSVKVNAEKLGMDESVVGEILAKYKFYENKWPELTKKKAPAPTSTSTSTSTSNKAGGRQLLKARPRG